MQYSLLIMQNISRYWKNRDSTAPTASGTGQPEKISGQPPSSAALTSRLQQVGDLTSAATTRTEPGGGGTQGRTRGAESCQRLPTPPDGSVVSLTSPIPEPVGIFLMAVIRWKTGHRFSRLCGFLHK